MQHLVMFLSDASEQETELKIFGLILLIIERLGESVKPYLPSILALLPRVWEQSDGNALLRIQVSALSGSGRKYAKGRHLSEAQTHLSVRR